MADDPTADLQFDKVVPAAPPKALACAKCGKPITGPYYKLRGHPLCESCRADIEAQLAAHFAKGRGGAGLARGALLGIGAAIAGAVLYFAVTAVTGWEIGIVAIVIGYMVGWAVRKGSNGVGGRAFQVMAALLTYFAVGGAYTMLAVKQGTQIDAFGAVIAIVAGPVYVVVNSGAGGIITAVIIGVGLVQAWRMTAGATSAIEGPFNAAGMAPAGSARA